MVARRALRVPTLGSSYPAGSERWLTIRRARQAVPRRAPLLAAAAIALAAATTPALAAEPDPTAGPPAPVDIAEATASATTPSRRSRISFQGGWWTLAAEWRTRPGVFLALGIPWVAVPLTVLNGATWVVPLDARVGYGLPISGNWSVRASAHAALSIAPETSKCGCDSPLATKRTFAFAEIGLRYDTPSGFLAGVEIPVVGVRLPHHWFQQPEALAFSQAYAGYSWDL